MSSGWEVCRGLSDAIAAKCLEYYLPGPEWGEPIQDALTKILALIEKLESMRNE